MIAFLDQFFDENSSLPITIIIAVTTEQNKTYLLQQQQQQQTVDSQEGFD